MCSHKGEFKKMKGAKKFQQMRNFEIMNCRKNISFYKDQMRKNYQNKKFYASEIALMQIKLDKLQDNFINPKF